MGMKYLKRLICPALAALCLTLPPQPAVSAEESVSEIEQIYVNMPEIRVYFSYIDESSAKPENIVAYCENDTYECSGITRFSETGDASDYYVLMDTSSSINDSSFAQVKQSVRYLQQKIKNSDRLNVIALGEKPEELYRSDKGGSLDEALDRVRATSSETSLYAALSYTSRLADSSSGAEFKRRECILFTDGYDNSMSQETMEETRAQFMKYGMPINTVSLGSAGTEDNKKLGELSSGTGGSMYVCFGDDNIREAVDGILERLGNSYVLIFRGKNNLVNNAESIITVRFMDIDVSKTSGIYMMRWQPDKTAPTVTGAVKEGRNSIRLSFSEDVLNAENAANYNITDESGKAIAVGKAAYENKDGVFTAVLTLENDIVRGKYSISCKNISDVSMEKNNVENKFSVSLDGVEPQNGFMGFLLSWQGILIIAAGVIVLAGIITALVIIGRRSARRKEEDVLVREPIQPLEPQAPDPPVMLRNMPPHPVTLRQSEALPTEPMDPATKKTEQKKTQGGAPKHVVDVRNVHVITLLIELDSGEKQEVEMEFEEKLVCGRSQSCDLCIDDKYMARNQFVIEKENGSCYITDLGSTNGTLVNGIRIVSRCRLNEKDVITAGKVKLTLLKE